MTARERGEESDYTTTNTTTASSYPSINIIGAGIAGLSLACHLRLRRIPFTIFDAASKPKGHNYGITISPWAYQDLLPAIEPKQSTQAFRKIIAVDRLVKGQGSTTASPNDNNDDDIRASDMALRELLSRGHQINWNHKVTSFETLPEGSRLTFENGKSSIARLTIDAGGERSGITSLLLPDLKPEILPYAVYHGTRYVSYTKFNRDFAGVFRDSENVRSFPPSTSSPASSSHWHLQIAKSYITKDDLPSKVKLEDIITPKTTTTIQEQEQEQETPIIEFRYTFSRPSNPPKDPLYTPTRAPKEATETPPTFFTEIFEYLSSSSSLPNALKSTILSSDQLQKDRILNWLMRVKPLPSQPENLQKLAEKKVIAIGDSVHSTPPVGSEGAGLAMRDAGILAGWIDEVYGGGNNDNGNEKEKDESEVVKREDVESFYEMMAPQWRDAVEVARRKLKDMHGSVEERSDNGKRLSGRI